MSSGVPVQYTPSHEVTRADDGAQLAWGTDGSLTSRTFGTDVTSYASDLLGRRTSTTTASGDVTSFSWDQVGRLTGVGDTASGSATDYTYAGGLRVGAETTTGEDTTSEAFAWDTLAGVPLLLSDGGHEYIYALGSAPVAQVDTVTGVVTFLHGDLVGSTRAATDASGTVVGTWDYSTFGVTTAATGGAAGDGAGVTRFLFAGEYQDDTGLYYLRARFYDPVTASFLSVDPALAATGSPYAYTSGNPLQMVDPLGLWSMPNPLGGLTNFVNDTVRRVKGGGSVSDLLYDYRCRVSGGFFTLSGGPEWPDPIGFGSAVVATALKTYLDNFTKLASGLLRQGVKFGHLTMNALKVSPWLRDTVRVSARYGTNLALGSLDGIMVAVSAADNYFFRYDGVQQQSDRIQFTVERTIVTEATGALVGSQTDPLAVKICVVTEGYGCGPAIAGSALVQTAASEGMGLFAVECGVSAARRGLR